MSVEGPPPLLTIAMPVFNGGAALRVALASLLAQTFTDWELLLIDDGSTDAAIAGLGSDLDTRIRIIADGANRGLATRLNQAIEMARGRYFARMDHDDVAHPERLEQQVNYLEANPGTDLLGTKCLALSEDNRVLGEFPFHSTHASICARPWLGFYLAHPSWMGRTAWFRKHHYADPAPFRCEDQELLLRAHAESAYHCLDSVLMAYRLRDKVRLKTILRTRLALALVQLHYFGGRRDFVSLAAAIGATVLRMSKDIFLPASTGVRSEVAGSIGAEQSLWWHNWLSRVSQAAGPEAGR
ncbi:Glycosyl transferase family 2 [Devosia sp. YR412]|uniref:glycosyltransferase family 2 protein n=1 Tax=Devosia sp. YR412 TaxID=1881030 RepID=UPI0008AF7B46|nr:glycosyltransferase family 2 protein [Devosia sp. YR412]SEQ32042.1 Glycosyl transferase family 2 [Devosia sp. YR412]